MNVTPVPDVSEGYYGTFVLRPATDGRHGFNIRIPRSAQTHIRKGLVTKVHSHEARGQLHAVAAVASAFNFTVEMPNCSAF